MTDQRAQANPLHIQHVLVGIAAGMVGYFISSSASKAAGGGLQGLLVGYALGHAASWSVMQLD